MKYILFSTFFLSMFFLKAQDQDTSSVNLFDEVGKLYRKEIYEHQKWVQSIYFDLNGKERKEVQSDSSLSEQILSDGKDVSDYILAHIYLPDLKCGKISLNISAILETDGSFSNLRVISWTQVAECELSSPIRVALGANTPPLIHLPQNATELKMNISIDTLCVHREAKKLGIPPPKRKSLFRNRRK